MQIKPEEISRQIAKSLSPIYLITGDEHLVLQEVCDAIRAQAKKQGFTERNVLSVDAKFDWNELGYVANAMSLFAEKKIVELRMPTGKPGQAGAKVLKAYCDDPSPDNILLIISGKLEAAARNSAWVKAIDKAGAVVTIWPVDVSRLPAWIDQRMKQKGLQPSRDAVQFLAEQVEGNLLAASQEIEKLVLLAPNSSIDLDVMRKAVADSARFDIFGLVDTALLGETARVVRMLDGLRQEGDEPIVVLWALAREIRQLAQMRKAIDDGQRLDQVLSQNRVWSSRQRPVKAALQRIHSHQCLRWIKHCARIDAVIKGQATGDAWQEIIELTTQLSGFNRLARVASPYRS